MKREALDHLAVALTKILADGGMCWRAHGGRRNRRWFVLPRTGRGGRISNAVVEAGLDNGIIEAAEIGPDTYLKVRTIP